VGDPVCVAAARSKFGCPGIFLAPVAEGGEGGEKGKKKGGKGKKEEEDHQVTGRAPVAF